MAVKGSDENLAGSILDVENALQVASANNMSIDTIGGSGLNILDIGLLNIELANGRYVVGDVFTSDGTIGHAIVIKNYNSTTGKYTYWDPATDDTSQFQIASGAAYIILSTSTVYFTAFQRCY